MSNSYIFQVKDFHFITDTVISIHYISLWVERVVSFLISVDNELL